MARYHGGKQKIGEKIASVIYDEATDIETNSSFIIKGYCEPFCGMLGVYQHIPDLFEDHRPYLKYKSGDMNKSVIKMWQSAQNGWKPPTRKISKKEFMMLAGNGKSSAEKGFIGHFYGYMSKYFKPFDGRSTKVQREKSSQKIYDIAQDLYDVDFSYGPYSQFSKLKGYIIYCDPPYAIQSHYYDEYDRKLSFDHENFWNWCRKMAENNIIFVSEYKAPSDFKKIWSSGKEKLYLL